MGQFAAIAMVLGSLLQSSGTMQEGEAAKDAAQFNANASISDADAQAERTRIIGRRIASQNLTRIAKSGVEVTGSPLDVLAQNASDTELQALREARAGRVAAALYRSSGANALMAAGNQASAELISGAAQGLYSFGGGVGRQGLYGNRTPTQSGFTFGRVGG